jgi:hypothetical protein
MLFDTSTHETQEVFTLAGRAAAANQGFTLSRDGRRIALVAVEEQSDLWMVAQR